MGVLDFLMSAVRAQCPACGRRALKGFMGQSVADAMRKGVRANPIWLWRECVCCHARYKERHYGDGSLESTSDDEWESSVFVPGRRSEPG